MPYTYDYPRLMVTVDIIVINRIDYKNEILLIRRGHEPYKGCWALPGGYVDIDEELVDAANRELKEETNLENLNLTQFKTYGSLGRDPRGRAISVIYYTIAYNQQLSAQAGDDAANAEWFDVDILPSLAFDHKQIIEDFLSYCTNIGCK